MLLRTGNSPNQSFYTGLAFLVNNYYGCCRNPLKATKETYQFPLCPLRGEKVATFFPADFQITKEMLILLISSEILFLQARSPLLLIIHICFYFRKSCLVQCQAISLSSSPPRDFYQRCSQIYFQYISWSLNAQYSISTVGPHDTRRGKPVLLAFFCHTTCCCRSQSPATTIAGPYATSFTPPPHIAVLSSKPGAAPSVPTEAFRPPPHTHTPSPLSEACPAWLLMGLLRLSPISAAELSLASPHAHQPTNTEGGSKSVVCTCSDNTFVLERLKPPIYLFLVSSFSANLGGPPGFQKYLCLSMWPWSTDLDICRWGHFWY